MRRYNAPMTNTSAAARRNPTDLILVRGARRRARAMARQPLLRRAVDAETRAAPCSIHSRAHCPISISSQANGQPLTLADWRGHWSVVYFGYTICPDVCPTTLQTLKAVWAELGGRGLHDKSASISSPSIPNATRPTYSANMSAFFSPDFIAATGSDEQLTRITRALGLVYSRTKNRRRQRSQSTTPARR